MNAVRHLVVSLFILGTSVGYSQLGPVKTDFHTLPLDASHIAVPWSNPAAEGALRVLLIGPYSARGDVIHLNDHLEMDLEYVALWDRENVGFDSLFPQPEHPEASREAVIKRLEQGLSKKKLDLIILAQSDPDVLPPAIQAQIIARVEGGVGLLMTSHGQRTDSGLATWFNALPFPDSIPNLDHGVGTLGIDRDLQAGMIACRASTAGRVVHLAFYNAPTENHCLIPVPDNPYNIRKEYADNAFALVTRAARWASGRDNPVEIVDVVDVSPKGPDDEEIPPGYPPEFIDAIRKNAFNQPLRPFAVQLTEPTTEALDVSYRLRHVGANLPDILRAYENAPLRKGETFYPLDVLAAPGNYLLDIWLKNRKGIVGWHTEPLYIPGWPTLSEISLAQEGKDVVWLKPNDFLVVNATVAPGPISTKHALGTIYARAVDSFGRQVASNDVTVNVDGGPVSLRLEIADVIAPLIQIEVFALSSAFTEEATVVQEAAREIFYLPVRTAAPPLDPITIVTTKTRPDYGTYQQLEIMRDRFGASVLHAPLSIDTLLAAGRTGLARASQLVDTSQPEIPRGLVRTPCLSSPDYRSQLQRTIESSILQSFAGGPAYYSLGAGNALTHSDVELCQGPDCMAVWHEDIQRAYGTLDAVNLRWGTDFLTWEEVEPLNLEHCRDTANYLPWIDFRSTMNNVFTRSITLGAEKSREVDPQAQIGFQPAPTLPKPQTGIQWDQIAAATDYMVVPDDPNTLRRLRSFGDLHPWSGVVVGNEQFDESQPSGSWLAWHYALEQVPALWLNEPFSGTLSRVVSPEGVDPGAFETFATIRNNLAHGLGTLLLQAKPYRNGIAFLDTPKNDLLVAALPTLDERDSRSETWFAQSLNTLGFVPIVHSLNSDLGLNADGLNSIILADTYVLTPEEIDFLKAFHKHDGLVIASRLPKELGTPLDVEDGGALPFLHPVLPNETNPRLWSNRPVWVRELQAGSPVSEQLDTLLSQAGNVPMPDIKGDSDERGDLHEYYFAYDSATLLAFLPRHDLAKPLHRATYSIPDDRYGYDLLATEPLPFKTRFQWSPTPGQPALLSILPYKVTGLRLDVPALASRGSRLPVDVTVEAKKADAPLGQHLIQIRVEGTSGKELPHYRQTLSTDEGAAHAFVPLAQNETPGRYLVTATDLLTGMAEEVLVTIQ